MQGESALRQILSGQDNANLLKIARSRGINVSREALLKPGSANGPLIEKILNDFTPDELNEIRARYLESTRTMHNFGDLSPEAWRTLNMQTYFPEVKVPQTVLNRTQQAIRTTIPERSAQPVPDVMQSALEMYGRQPGAYQHLRNIGIF